MQLTYQFLVLTSAKSFFYLVGDYIRIGLGIFGGLSALIVLTVLGACFRVRHFELMVRRELRALCVELVELQMSAPSARQNVQTSNEVVVSVNDDEVDLEDVMPAPTFPPPLPPRKTTKSTSSRFNFLLKHKQRPNEYELKSLTSV